MNDNYLRERYEKYLKREKSNNTITTFINNLNLLYGYFSEKTGVANDSELFLKTINGDMIADYFDELRSDKKYSIATINLKIATLQNFYKYLIEIRQEDIKNPMKEVKQQYVEAPSRIVLRKDEVKKLIASTYKREKGDRQFDFLSTRNRFLISLLTVGGFRISEVLNTTMEDLEKLNVNGIPAVAININKNRVKNKLDKRVIISGEVLGYYYDYISEREKIMEKKNIETDLLIFSDNGLKLTNTGVNKMIRKYKKISGVLVDEKFTAHNFRHTCATIMSNNRNNSIATVKRVLGWTIKGMEGIYCHTEDIDRLRASADILK